MRDLSRSEERPVEEVEAQRLRKAKFERVTSVSKCKKPELPLATVGTTEEKARRKTGIDILGEVPWGTHFCVFYQSKQDLIDILVPYFKEGLENNEFCMWITSEPLSAEDAEKSLSQAVTNLDDYIKKGQIEILDYSQCYTKSGKFQADRVLQGWVQKHDEAIKRGFDGLRVTGNTFWLEKKDWVKFADYEAVVNSVICKYRMLAICTYSLDKCGASEILDVENNHQFSLIKWRGDWKILESSSKNQLEARLAEQTAIAQALERSKKDWVKTFNAMSDWVALIDLKGRILRSNRAGENFTGKTLDEIIGQSCCKFVHGSDKHVPGCPFRIMLHTRQRATSELNEPNTNRWLMVTVDPVVDGKGNLIGAVHITRDITQRKKDEKALRENEERYRYLFEQSPLGIGLSTPDGKVVRANKAMEVITGYFEEEFKKINLADTYENPQDRKKLLETIERYGCAVDFPVRLKHKDGTIYDALLNVSRVHLAGQDLFQTICLDITERKRAEEALRESEERISQIIQENSIATFVIDSNHIITHWNRACENLTGISASEAIGTQKQWSAFYSAKRPVMADLISDGAPEDEMERYYSGEYRKSTLIESAYEAEDFFPSLGEKGKWLFFTAAPLKNIKGRVIGAIETLQDITERKQAEEQIEKLARFPAENPNPVIRISARGTVVYGNDASLPLMKVWRCGVNGSVSGRWYEFVLDALSSGQNQQTEVKCDGQTFSLVFAPVMDANYVNVYGLDITERKQAAEALRASCDYLERLTNSMWDAVFSVKMPERVIEWGNDSFNLTGYEPQDCIGKTTEFLYPDKREFIDFGNKLKKAIEAGDDLLHAEQLLRRKNGEVFPAEITTTFFREKGQLCRVTSIVRDITERKLAEKKVLEYQKQLRSMASELSLVEERERRCIAEGLHDEISQPLAFLNIKLDLLKKSAKERSFINSFSEMEATIGKLISSARTFTFDLSSPVLYELGLEAGIEDWLNRNIQAKYGIATTFEDDGQIKHLDDDMRGSLFKAVKELLVNVVKHAKASSVKVSIVRDEDKIKICVEDNGVGFDSLKKRTRLIESSCYGLFSIRERLDYLGGSFHIESKLDRGTKVTLVAPLKLES